ncbi:MAG: RsmB/NOP family class I SAM-dependent RNA methyltransferase [Maricaulaceae bacterium]
MTDQKPSSGAPKPRAPRQYNKDEARGEKRERVTLSSSAQTRLYAAHAVGKVLRDKVTLEAALSAQKGYQELDGRDRAFARLIAATVFRRYGQITGVLKPMLKSPPPTFPMAVLQTATAQILFLDTAPHAAVGEAVTVLKSSSKTRGFAGLANAVLRKVAESGKDKAGMIAPSENIPRWLSNSWIKAYGRPAVRKMAMQLANHPPLDFSLKDTSAEDQENWAAALEAETLPTGTLRRPRIGDVTALPGFEEGAWWAQDIAASLPVKIMAETLAPNGDLSGKRILDLCAAPGGKTLQAAAMGADVTAIDISQARLKTLSANLERMGLSAAILAADARKWKPENEDELFDAVLLDAPCSATGTFRRHPDVLFNKAHTDIGKLAALQDALLRAAANLVKPGGTLIFCTCSIQKEEGEARIPGFLQDRPDFCLNPLTSASTVSALPILSPEGYVRSLPQHMVEMGGMDGFFIARLTRREN